MKVVIYISHIDDEILGVGGLMPQLVEAGHDVDVVYATDGFWPPEYDKRPEAEAAAEILGHGPDSIHYLGIETGRLDEHGVMDLSQRFEALALEPDLIITNSKHDIHQDHRRVFESAMVVGRSIDEQIGVMTCETISSSEQWDEPFEPNFYIDIAETIEQKKRAMEVVESELEEWPHPRCPQGIEVKARQRGMEVGLDYAEAFHLVQWFDMAEPLTPE